MRFRRIEEKDADVVWDIISNIIQTGDTWVFAPDSSREKMLAIWFDTQKYAYVCELENEIVGTFFIKANQPDLGSHVANAGYMVKPDYRGRGIAEAMCRFSLDEARRLGFRAMQFNSVVSTNEVAIRLWKRCGFEVIGTLPKAFHHQTLGFTDALVMYQWLG
ncbi:GNAT family N-acetyltransferase [Spirosoma aureum]|uniref:GNAT family N-acetyltransferase n=1 Tax=Spirosoma aureum TaxID=2692134 RepID=A0A6G9AKH7_9BACT|nr:GNAT family N-acetyltransferase [Spirosoma aureum]QIP12829.1 GNAT family N-acetyltransferase [Spirosoma aureum]